MAHFPDTEGWIPADSVAAYLRRALPESYVVVAEPLVSACPIDSIVVGSQGLSIIQATNGNQHTPEELEQRGVTPAECRKRSIRAVRAFMADEFPKLKPAIRYYQARSNPEAEIPLWHAEEAGAMIGEPLADTLTLADTTVVPAWANEDVVKEIAAALGSQQLTATQRTSQPFVFRSGGSLRVGAKAWTLKQAVEHMNHYPEDGIYHLRNGTLAAWLDAEGATRLAQLARDAVVQTRSDWRAALETFLLGTGLVRRPKLQWKPRVVDLGYVLQGQPASRVLKLSHGPGRGYLYGEITTDEPWLHTEPRVLSGGPLEVVVSADTDKLAIHQAAQPADVVVDSTASEEPIHILARVRVTAMPSEAIRWIFRPLFALILSGVLGAGVGALFAYADVPVPAALANLQIYGVNAWVLFIGVLWAIFGLMRGEMQLPAWPAVYAGVRWVVRALAWAGILALLGVVLVWAWRLGANTAAVSPERAFELAALVGLALAVIPSSLSEAGLEARAANPNLVRGRRNVKQIALISVVLAVVLIGLVTIPRYVVPVVGSAATQESLREAQVSLSDRWQQLEARANGVFDDLYVRYYDRRASADAATPAVLPAKQPDVETGQP